MRFCNLRIIIWGILFVGLGKDYLHAQISQKIYATDHRINPENKKKLFVEIDNLSFFRNAESVSYAQKGYTLPGFWLQMKAVYYPTENVKLEGGIHSIWFWGANKYPAFAYNDIAVWRGEESNHKVHLLPFFRAQVALSDKLDVLLGNIYRGSNHRLIEPLYNPELNLSADPEAGLQILYHPHWMNLDLWLNWESFIYKLDTHQEAFTFGLSSRFKINSPESRLHAYIQMQALAQHRGGEIDTINGDMSVQTMLNGATGIGLDWNIRYKALKKINLELDLTGYYQHAGNLWPVKRGYGWYGSASADLTNFQIRTAYWECNNFISLFGNPFYGVISTYLKDVVYHHPKMAYVGAEYSRRFSDDFSIGINADAYYRIGTQMKDPKKVYNHEGDRLNYSFGLFFRFNPAFFIKTF